MKKRNYSDDDEFDEPVINIRIGQKWREAEKELISKTLEYNEGNKTKTAKELGYPRSVLYEKLKKYGIGKWEFKLDLGEMQ